MSWSAGDRCGRYALIEPLGRGAVGEVWHADLAGPGGFRKPVALKLLRSDVPSARGRASMVREARLGALVSHPNLASTLELGEHEGTLFVAMELVRGVTVHQLARRTTLPAAVVLDIGVQTCAGLRHLHALEVDGEAAGLVHRDIKPANLLVDRHGRVKVADLGIAALGGHQEEALGTPGFASPEQVAGHRLDGRADLFSLGATLFLIATRHRFLPRGAWTTAELVKERLRTPGLRDRVDAAVRGLGPVLWRALAPDPADRPADAVELAAALAALHPRQPPGPSLLQLLAGEAPELDIEDISLSAPPGAATPTVAYRSNLPRARDRFFGREGLLRRLVEALASPGLVALHGPGGMGKTRLSLEAARKVEGSLSGAAWLVELGNARSSGALFTTLAQSLGLRLDGSDPVARIGRAMAARGRALFVLDNLEQLPEAALAAVASLCAMAPDATVLCTSRHRVPGAVHHEVGPLTRAEAADLFEDRAARAPGPGDRPLVEEIVEALDRMPLAIELTAARTRLVGVSALHARVRDGRLGLAGGGRAGPDRHRSVRAALEGSWALLDPGARRALTQLSVFEGGFTLQAAEAVLDLDTWALDVLGRLVDASLVTVDAERERFGMLGLVQEYATERAGDRVQAETRHGRFMAQLGSPELLDSLDGPAGPASFARLADDLDNLAVATERAAERGDGATALACARAAWAVLQRHGPYRRGQDLAEKVVAVCAEADRPAALAVLAHALGMQGQLPGAVATLDEAIALAESRGESDRAIGLRGAQAAWFVRQGLGARALPAFEAQLALLRRRGDRRAETGVLSHLGVLLLELGRPAEAEPCIVEALRLQRHFGNRLREASCLDDLARLRHAQGRIPEALEHFNQALHCVRELGSNNREAALMSNLATLLREQGRSTEARELLEGALEIHRRDGDRRGETNALINLGVLCGAAGLVDDAERWLLQGLAVCQEIGVRRGEGIVLYNLGFLAWKQGRAELARERLEAALVVHREVHNRISEGLTLGALAQFALEAGDLGLAEARAEEARQIGQQARNPRVEGVSARQLGRVARARGDHGRARGHLVAAEALLGSSGDRTLLLEALCERAELEAEAGASEVARRFLDQAQALADALEIGPRSESAEALARAWAAVAPDG